MLLCLTANHRTADFALLETLSRRTDGTARRLVSESDFVSGAVVVSTCNRIEYYLDVDDPVEQITARERERRVVPAVLREAPREIVGDADVQAT